MATEIRCTNKDSHGAPCDRFLATLDKTKLRIYCQKCKGWHDVPIVDLVRYLALQVESQGGGEVAHIFL